MKEKNRISCIIPAYNEGNRIEAVLKIIQNHPLINEVIAINDGSTDDAASVIKKFKNVRLIDLKKNGGKASALAAGIRKAHYNYLIFIDADLINLKKKDITSIIKPILKKEADVSISLRKNVPFCFRLIGLDFISGERVIPKSLFCDLKELKKIPSWGIEAYINKRIIEKELKIKVVRWKEVISPYPSTKFGFVKGNLRFLGMMRQIIHTIGLIGVPTQIIKMLKLQVK